MNKTMLTLLHTSDWHLGRNLHGKPRYDEFFAFLQWQLSTIREQNVDILLIAGDIFDTNTPNNQTQQLYYQFLGDVAKSGCRHVVIVAGNHDSPSFLDAPKSLLKFLNVHVIGTVNNHYLADEVLILHDKNHEPEIIISAVPYLRDRDVRQVGSGETLADKENQLVHGIHTHYQKVNEIAFAKKQALEQQFNKQIPIIATGHLFMVGGQTVEGDGVKDLYVGTLGSVTTQIFETSDNRYDYVALGHLHVPQIVGGDEKIRYSGSPIAMGFGEANQQKQVNLVRFFADKTLLTKPILPQIKTLKSYQTIKNNKNNSLDLFSNFDNDDVNLNQPYNVAIQDDTVIQSLTVPVFKSLCSVKGDLTEIKKQLKILVKSQIKVWIEVSYQGDDFVSDLREQVDEIVKNSNVEVLRTKNLQLKTHSLQAQALDETLDELNEQDVFERCMIANQVAEADKPMLLAKYAQVLEDLNMAHQPS